jgi:hypothetical protein
MYEAAIKAFLRISLRESHFLISVLWWMVEWAGFREKHLGFKRESPERSPGLPHETRKGGSFLTILLLVKFRSIVGRLTALIVWARKGRR